MMSKVNPDRFFAGVVGLVTLAWLLMGTIDFLGVGNLRGDGMIAAVDRPLVLLWVFGEGGPTELLQWTFLGACLVLLLREIRDAGTVRPPGHGKAMTVVFIGLGLMFLEDTLNTRHLVVQHILPLLAGPTDERSVTAIGTELALYALMGGFMLAFLGLSFRAFRAAPPALRYLALGFAAYAVAAVASASRHIGDWYRTVGDAIIASIAPEAIALYDSWAPAQGIPSEALTLGFWFMDLAVEESLEVVAAAALLSALWHLRRVRVIDLATASTAW
jgi:hypothetical protein